MKRIIRATILLGAWLAATPAVLAEADDPMKDPAVRRVREAFRVDTLAMLDIPIPGPVRGAACNANPATGISWCATGTVYEASESGAFSKQLGYHLDPRGRIVHAVLTRREFPLDRAKFDEFLKATGARYGGAPITTAFTGKTAEGDEVQAVIAVWGPIKLVRLNEAELRAVAAGGTVGRGPLVDYRQNPRASAQARDPVFKIDGSAGFIVQLRSVTDVRTDIMQRFVFPAGFQDQPAGAEKPEPPQPRTFPLDPRLALFAERARVEAERVAAIERARREEEERRAAEARRIEEERKAAEEKIRRDEEERKAAEERARREEAERKAAAERARREEEERKAAEARRVEEERKAAEEKVRREEEERKAAAERARREEEERRAAEERARRAEAERKAAEERARAEAERKAVEERARIEAERKVAEERARRAEAERKAAEERARIEAERKAAEERARAEAERKAAEERARIEAERRAAEERARVEAERKAAEERRAMEERARRAEAEYKAAAERARRAEADRLAAEERVRVAETERKAAEERAKRIEEERKAAEERAKREDEERKAAEERIRRSEAERKVAEERARALAEERRLEEARRIAAERASREETQRKAAAAKAEEERRAAEARARRAEAERVEAERRRRIAEQQAEEARRAAERPAAPDRPAAEAPAPERPAAGRPAAAAPERPAAERPAPERKVAGVPDQSKSDATPGASREAWLRMAAAKAKAGTVHWVFNRTRDRISDDLLLQAQAVFTGGERLAVEIAFECNIDAGKRLKAFVRAFDARTKASLRIPPEDGQASVVRGSVTLDENAPQTAFIFPERDERQASIVEVPMTHEDVRRNTPRAQVWLRHYQVAIKLKLPQGEATATVYPYDDNLRRVLEGCMP